MAHGLSFSVACGTLLDEGLTSSLLRWQADSLPLRHQGSPGSSVSNAACIILTIHRDSTV